MALAAESAVQEELQQYLAEKGVNSLFVKIVEQLLLEKPDKPTAFIIKYLLEAFPEDTAEYGRKAEIIASVEAKAASVRNEAPSHTESKEDDDHSSSSSSESDADDEVEDLPALKARATASVGRRSSVSAAVLKYDPGSSPKRPVFSKSAEEAAKLHEAISDNILCAHLDEEDVSTIVDAFEKMELPAETDIIVQGDLVAEHYYILGEGSAEVYKDGNKLDLVYAPGDGFGELALMYNAPRAATVKTVGACTVWRLDQVTFKSILMGSAMKKRERYINFLQTVPILGEMAPNERMVLADALRERRYKGGETIVSQGDSGDEFYIIADGTVMVECDGKFVSELNEGAYFGEIALLTSKKRQATVTAKSDTVKVLTVHRKVFQRVLGPLSDILSRNMEAYSSWLIK